MQKLLTELFWGNEELHHAAAERCKALPGYWDDQYSGYETRAYYSLGLNLRQDILQLLDP